MLHGFQPADAAAQLSRNQQGTGYLGDNILVVDLASSGAIKVDNMQSWCSQRLPLKGYLYRLVGEYRFLPVITLIEANALTISEVYGRDDFRNSLPYRLILEYLRQGRAKNALLCLSLFSSISSDLFITFLVSLGMMISSM